MSVQALGAYLEGLIDERRLDNREVTRRAGVAMNYVGRLRTGDTQDPGARNVAALVQAARGSFAVAAQLLLREDATVEEGRQAARETASLSDEQLAQLDRIELKFARVIKLGEGDPERLSQIVNLLRENAEADPGLLDMVLGVVLGRHSRMS